MCDGELHEIDKLKDVEGRMKRRCGIMNETYEEEFEEARKKIQNVRLNPECKVEDGIVITDGIKSTETILESSDICFCKGAIGSDKTVLKNYIAKRYKNKGWTIRMREEHIKQEDTVVTDSQKVLLCCDNFLGRFNFAFSPKVDLQAIEKLLEQQYKPAESPRSLKILVLIHQHVYDELQKKVQSKLMQNKNITKDMYALSRAEAMMIFKEQGRIGHCSKDAKCWIPGIEYKDIETKLKLSMGIVGSPALTMVYTNLHALFSNDSFSKSPFSRLQRHCLKMKDEEKNLYYTLVFIMLVREYRLDDNLPEWCENLPVTKDDIKNNISKLPFYVQGKGDVFEIRHEILYIALYRACFMDSSDLSLVSHCDLRTILQLALPSHCGDTTNDFTVLLPKVDTKDYAKTFIKPFAKRISNAESIHSLILEHPLINDTILKSKIKMKKK